MHRVRSSSTRACPTSARRSRTSSSDEAQPGSCIVPQRIWQRGAMTTRTESMQQWERAEIARSSVEATLTADEALRVSRQTFERYADPPARHGLPARIRVSPARRRRRQADRRLRVRLRREHRPPGQPRRARLGDRHLGRSPAPRAAAPRRERPRRGATFIAGSAHDMPFPDDSIDVVFGIAILHHLDLDLVSREVRRVLKPGGRAIFQEPVRNSAVVRFVRSLIPYRAPDISPYERPLTDEELETIRRRGSRSGRCAPSRLPHVQVGQVLPIVKNHWQALYELDRTTPAPRAVAGALRLDPRHFPDEIIRRPFGGCGTPVITPSGTVSSRRSQLRRRRRRSAAWSRPTRRSVIPGSNGASKRFPAGYAPDCRRSASCRSSPGSGKYICNVERAGGCIRAVDAVVRRDGAALFVKRNPVHRPRRACRCRHTHRGSSSRRDRTCCDRS